MKNVKDNVILGGEEWIVAEVDESDGTHLNFHPQYSVLTNLEHDHPDHYGDLGGVKRHFRQFLEQLPSDGTFLYCKDCPNLAEVVELVPRPHQTYGTVEGVDYRACRVTFDGMQSSFELYYREEFIGVVTIAVPGKHNVLNALAAIGLVHMLGSDFEVILPHVSGFRGAKRRLELKWDQRGIMVFDDYAHHPTEIRAALEALKVFGKKVTCVFQPHRYTRLNSLFHEFRQSFWGAEKLILTEIYSAGEENALGLTSEILQTAVERETAMQVLCMKKEQVVEYLTETVMEDQVVVFLGAGDITRVADLYVSQLESKSDDGVLQF